MDFVALVQLVLGVIATLAGFPALLSLVLTALEYFNKISHDAAETVNFWANAALFVGIFVLAVMGRLDLVNQIDVTLGQLAKVLTEILIVLGVPLGFAITRAVHGQLRESAFMSKRFRALKAKVK